VRKALPNQIVFKQNQNQDTVTGAMIADSPGYQDAVTNASIAPSQIPLITGSVAQRVSNPQTNFVDYILPNMKRMTNPDVRAALLEATSRSGYIAGAGGNKMGDPAQSIVNPTVIGYQPNALFSSINLAGDPAKAKQLLADAGYSPSHPYPITFTYFAATDSRKAAAEALAAGWTAVGFKVTLNPVVNNYWAVVENPSDTSDVYWSDFSSAWPSAATLLNPQFNSSQNLTSTSKGQDYGWYANSTFNSLMAQGGTQATEPAAATYYMKADAVAAKDSGYMPLMIEKFLSIRGSGVTGYINNPGTSMYPDLGSVGVAP
jgi:peptide/nickel transport system substrate-binding protein